MTKEELFDIKIDDPDRRILNECKRRWDGISKPIDGLGDFEEVICRIGAIRRSVTPSMDRRVLVIMCADNKVVDEGISQSKSDITLAVARALGKGIGTACSIGRLSGCDVVTVDVGIDCEEIIEGVRSCKIRRGAEDFLKAPAMSAEDVLKAIQCGIDMAKELSGKGYEILLTGEVGIGNTTTSAAVLCSLISADPDLVVGRGAGLDDEGLARKKDVVKRGILKYGFDSCAEPEGRTKEEAFEILRCLGGLDIAALSGLFIGGALCHMPVVIDGLISSVAALLAEKFCRGCSKYMIASHKGREEGNMLALSELGLKPFIDGNMALGEGTGAMMAMPLFDVAFGYYLKGAQFEDYKIDSYKRFN